MSKTVTVEELRENLEERLEEVRNGEVLNVVDNGTMIAKIERPELEIIRHDPSLRLQDFKPGRPPKRLDSVEWLIAERERERSGKKYGL
jgi:antitoxin (DNA-binding transcriptional repressor) of toxin-antitoxin stability system